MNKHSIILPMLITSAVSLHVLSFYLEEPEEFADIPTPISSSLETANPDQSVAPVDPNTTTTVDVNVQNSSTPVTQESTQVAQASTEPAQTPETPASITSVTTTTTTTTGSGVQVAAALIPTKNYNDMLREAKQIGGRIDPFLSMKPPEIETIPEIPEPSVNPDPVSTKPNTVINKPGYTGTRVIPNPPNTWTPTFDNSSTPTTRPTSKPTIIASIPKGNTSTGNNTKPPITVKPTSKPTTVIITPVAKIDDGLELTGIITGLKPLALITVDSESKVYKVGDVIRKEGRIKLVSIDFDNETVTISDANNKKSRLSIK